MTIESEVLAVVAANPDVASRDGSTHKNLLAAAVEHYKVRQAVGALGLTHSPSRVAQSFSPLTRTATNTTGGGTGDDVYFTLATITVPGGTMGLHSVLRITLDWSYINSSVTKTLGLNWGGSEVSAPSVTTTSGYKGLIEIANRGSLSTQVIQNNANYGAAARAADQTQNTANDVALAIKCKWNGLAGAETITLIGYSVWHYPGTV